MGNNYFSSDKIGRLRAKEHNEKISKLIEEEYKKRNVASSKFSSEIQEALNKNTRELLLKHINDSLL